MIERGSIEGRDFDRRERKVTYRAAVSIKYLTLSCSTRRFLGRANGFGALSRLSTRDYLGGNFYQCNDSKSPAHAEEALQRRESAHLEVPVRNRRKR